VRYIGHFNTQLVTAFYKSLSHRLVFSVTVFTALLGNGFQQWTSLCSRITSSLAGGHLAPTSYSSGCRLRTLSLLMSADPLYTASELTQQKTPLPTILILLHNVLIETGHVENTTSHSYSIVACYTAVT
jgi:hypothetical protein